MNRTLLQTVVRHAEALAAPTPTAPDAELLTAFVGSQDAEAFAELVRRHGPMVWAVCRHTLTDPDDADDAFQATFLALVRSARSIRTGAAVGGWLHGVAVRVCTKLRRSEARRRQREHKAACPEADRPIPDSTWDGLLSAVHEEVQNLPEAERTAFVLCDLEGVRQPDAAERLGWKLGTLSGRLTKARQRLLERLTSRGLTPALVAGGLGIGATSHAAVPDDLVHNVVVLSKAGGAVPQAILKLVTGVVPMSRTKLFVAAAVAAGGLSLGFGGALLNSADAQTPDVVKEVNQLLGSGSADGGGQGEKGRPGQGAAGLPPGGAQPPRGSGGGPPAGQGFPGGAGAPSGGGSGGPPPGMSMPGGPPMGGMGGAGGMMMGGGMAPSGPPRPQWDYLFADRPNSADDFKKVLRTQGEGGWEYVGTGPGEILVFKRTKTVPFSGGMGMTFGQGTGGPAMGGGEGGGTRGFGGGNRGGGGSDFGGGGLFGGGRGGSGGSGSTNTPAGSGDTGSTFEPIPLKKVKAEDFINPLGKLFPAVQLRVERASNTLTILKASPKEAAGIRMLMEGLEKHPNPSVATLETLAGSLGGTAAPPGSPTSGSGLFGGGGMGPMGGFPAAGGPPRGGMTPAGGGVGARKELVTLTLDRADAKTVENLVSQMLSGRDFRLNAVPGSNALLLHADADTIKFAQQVVEALDKASTPKKK